MIQTETNEREQSISNSSDIAHSISTESLKNLVSMTPKNIAIIELISSEQRFVYDMKNILKVTFP